MVESSDKMWSTGEWNSKSLQYSCLENTRSVNSMKRQKDRTLKDELPRFVGANMLLVMSGEITAERMKRWSHKSQATVSVQESPVVNSLASSQTAGREHHPTHQQKI